MAEMTRAPSMPEETKSGCDFCKAGRALVLALVSAVIFWKARK